MGKREEKGRGMAKEEEKGKTVIVSGRDIAESMDFCCNLLPGDLILDILSRLPVQCLLKFKCVCKTWFNILLSRTFISMHLKRSNNNKNSVSLLHQHTNRVFSHFRLFHHHVMSLSNNNLDTELHSPFQVSRETAIVGSCNGLVCIISRPSFNSKLILWNPATRECRRLPKPRIFEDIYYSEFAFHHHPTIDDYKLLRFCFHYDNYGNTSTINTRLDVFTLSTNSWREIDPVVIPRQNYRFTDLVAVNGSWHWLGGKVGKLRNFEDFVFAFDVVEEKFRQIEVPCSDCANYVEFCRTLSVFQETLAMFVFPSLLSERNSCFDIWVLNDYGGANESWTKQLTVGPIPIVATPQGFWISGEVIMKRFKHDNDAFLYDPLTSEIKNFPSCMAAKCEFFCYTESLVSVK